MNESRLKHPFSIELEFDRQRVTKEKILELMASVEPLTPSSYPANGLSERWGVVQKGECWSVMSPIYQAQNSSLDNVAAAVSLLNFEGYSQEFSSPISSNNSYLLNLGVADITLVELLEFYQAAYRIEPAIKTVIPGSRYNNPACKLMKKYMDTVPADFHHMANFQSFGQSVIPAVSLDKYLHNGFISINYFSGTSNVNKVLYWLLLWCSVLDRVLLEGPPAETLDTIEKVVNWLRWPSEGQMPLVGARTFFVSRAASLREARLRRSSSNA